jgi:hypothetical protein
VRERECVCVYVIERVSSKISSRSNRLKTSSIREVIFLSVGLPEMWDEFNLFFMTYKRHNISSIF